MSFGVGIIGCGTISNFHARAIESLDNARLVGGCSRSFDSTSKFAAQHQCRAFASLEEMLADDRVDVVSICSPSGAHLEPAVAAAEAGKHVVVEKPLEVTLERCDKIIQACDTHGVLLSTIFQSRFHEVTRLLKQTIDDGRFGKLVLGNAYVKWFRTQEYYDSGAWRGTWKLDGGGALMNQAIHSIDLLTWLMGPVLELSAMTSTLTHQRIEVEDTAVATLKFSNGALGTIEATTSAYPGSLKKIEIYGESGSAVIEEEAITKWEFAEPTPQDDELKKRYSIATLTGGGAADPTAISFEAHAKQFADIFAAIESGRKPLVDGREARRSVEIVTAIYEAAKSGMTVRLPN